MHTEASDELIGCPRRRRADLSVSLDSSRDIPQNLLSANVGSPVSVHWDRPGSVVNLSIVIRILPIYSSVLR